MFEVGGALSEVTMERVTFVFLADLLLNLFNLIPSALWVSFLVKNSAVTFCLQV